MRRERDQSSIAVINAGSSSIKLAVYNNAREPELLLKGRFEGIGSAPKGLLFAPDGKLLAEKTTGPLGHDGAMDVLVELAGDALKGTELAAVGHRVVHGGPRYAEPVVVTDALLQELESFVPLAPLHQPHNLAPIRAIAARNPSLPQVACFDTAFHRRQPAVAQAFALPAWITTRGVRRYGFHGLSYEYIASVLPAIDPVAAAGRTVVAHLGNGASMCAMVAGHSVASTMGFTAVEGLPMGTRSGTLDPGVVLYLMDELHMDPRAIEKLLYQQSGLLGMSGVSSDMRDLLASDAPNARLAVDVFVYRAARELGSLTAALGGLDALVFTAGIGENQPEVRARICRQAAWLGVELDPVANLAHGPCITTRDSRVAAYVVPTDEELMIARHVARLLEH